MKLKLVIIALIFILTGCSVAPRFRTEPGEVKTKSLETQIGIASYYSEEFHGRKTASGEIFDMNKISAAHRDYPLGTVVKVTNLKNNKSIILRINDRGPFVKEHERIIDLSYGAAKELGFVLEGTTLVKVEVLEWGTQLK